jgi:hypothetical protein
MNILCKTPFYEKFQKINISAPNSPRPEFLKNVPTIVVPNIDRPLEGEEVFRWLETQSEQQAKAGGGDEIQPYMPGEMGMAMGGSYSYLDVDDDAKQPMEHTFVFIGRPEEKMRTPKEEEFVDAKPRPVQGVDMTNRPPMPQALQQQVNHAPSMSRPPMIPQSTAGGSNNRDDFDQAYNELINRRKMDTPVPQQRQ